MLLLCGVCSAYLLPLLPLLPLLLLARASVHTQTRTHWFSPLSSFLLPRPPFRVPHVSRVFICRNLTLNPNPQTLKRQMACLRVHPSRHAGAASPSILTRGCCRCRRQRTDGRPGPCQGNRRLGRRPHHRKRPRHFRCDLSLYVLCLSISYLSLWWASASEKREGGREGGREVGREGGREKTRVLSGDAMVPYTFRSLQSVTVSSSFPRAVRAHRSCTHL